MTISFLLFPSITYEYFQFCSARQLQISQDPTGIFSRGICVPVTFHIRVTSWGYLEFHTLDKKLYQLDKEAIFIILFHESQNIYSCLTPGLSTFVIKSWVKDLTFSSHIFQLVLATHDRVCEFFLQSRVIRKKQEELACSDEDLIKNKVNTWSLNESAAVSYCGKLQIQKNCWLWESC